MAWLIAGLVLFLGAHSVQMLAPGWRAAFIRQRGDGPWKGLYSLVAGVGFALIWYGYGHARGAPPLYALPPGLFHPAFALVWLGFVFVVAAYWPGNHIQRAVRDPMVAGVGLWALGHLLVNATPNALVLFGGFLVWAIADFVSLRRRRAVAKGFAVPPKVVNTVLVVITGTILGAVFVHVLHVWLIGVSPMAYG